METIPQMQFEFNQWKEAFKTFRENYPIYGDKIRMVIATDSWVSGYWIENNSENKTGLLSGDHIYIGQEVFELEKRVTTEIELAEKEKRSPKLTF